MKILVHISLSVLQTYFNKICPKYDSSMQTYNTFCVQPKGIVWRPIYDRINDGMRHFNISVLLSDDLWHTLYCGHTLLHTIYDETALLPAVTWTHLCPFSPSRALLHSLQPLSHFIDRMDPARANGIGKRESSSLHQPMSLRAARVHTPSDKNPERALAFVHLIPARVSRIGTRTAREANIGKQGA